MNEFGFSDGGIANVSEYDSDPIFIGNMANVRSTRRYDRAMRRAARRHKRRRYYPKVKTYDVMQSSSPKSQVFIMAKRNQRVRQINRQKRAKMFRIAKSNLPPTLKRQKIADEVANARTKIEAANRDAKAERQYYRTTRVNHKIERMNKKDVRIAQRIMKEEKKLAQLRDLYTAGKLDKAAWKQLSNGKKAFVRKLVRARANLRNKTETSTIAQAQRYGMVGRRAARRLKAKSRRDERRKIRKRRRKALHFRYVPVDRYGEVVGMADIQKQLSYLKGQKKKSQQTIKEIAKLRAVIGHSSTLNGKPVKVLVDIDERALNKYRDVGTGITSKNPADFVKAVLKPLKPSSTGEPSAVVTGPVAPAKPSKKKLKKMTETKLQKFKDLVNRLVDAGLGHDSHVALARTHIGDLENVYSGGGDVRVLQELNLTLDKTIPQLRKILRDGSSDFISNPMNSKYRGGKK